eukprot:Hpha_TRINITY_DN35624_c0_g1::TRINITY_DN35624_c0_g1_i1::g.68674::m.68674
MVRTVRRSRSRSPMLLSPTRCRRDEFTKVTGTRELSHQVPNAVVHLGAYIPPQAKHPGQRQLALKKAAAALLMPPPPQRDAPPAARDPPAPKRAEGHPACVASPRPMSHHSSAVCLNGRIGPVCTPLPKAEPLPVNSPPSARQRRAGSQRSTLKTPPARGPSAAGTASAARSPPTPEWERRRAEAERKAAIILGRANSPPRVR